MEKEDLRIGNYVNYEQTTHTIAELHSDKVLHVWNGSKDRHGSGWDGYYTNYDQIKPIELTDEEFISLGFVSLGIENKPFKKGVC